MTVTITSEDVRRLAARLDGVPFVDEWDFSGCAIYDGGARCGAAAVDTLIPIYGDHDGDDFSVSVCAQHLREHMAEHLLVAACGAGTVGVVPVKFPSAEETLNRMLEACRHPHSTARVKLGSESWQDIPGPELLTLIKDEVPDLRVDYVRVVGR